MRTPTIHMNGTSRDALFDETANALGALRDALRAMGDAGPNARDYYPQGEGAFTEARNEHEARIRKVREVMAELEAIAEAIQDAP